ncbi:hypothetical protein G7085_06115 [Tessaracoccus sp. HDW20]|uniref:hypothetical protein n=1 Tax=Tessaracoccus coleopterorum TaxID=2714950 RepID=UPI0018D41F24|nr:hypothetical protein [Tessaracoccus coleopterorum]NHB84327.1 hypothetical protein [Tessaracoccus coleopterorum]
MSEVAGDLPALKLDLTQQQATLTVLQPNGSVASYRWDNGEITRVDSDLQYLSQATFNPAEYPLNSLGRMFDIADLRGVRGQLVLQVVEYRAGQIVMTVTSRPESKTVFFRQDGTAVASLGLTSVADITAGIDEVIGDAEEAYSVSLNPTVGYSADLPDAEAGVVLNRTRPAEMPTFETRRTESPRTRRSTRRSSIPRDSPKPSRGPRPPLTRRAASRSTCRRSARRPSRRCSAAPPPRIPTWTVAT